MRFMYFQGMHNFNLVPQPNSSCASYTNFHLPAVFRRRLLPSQMDQQRLGFGSRLWAGVVHLQRVDCVPPHVVQQIQEHLLALDKQEKRG